MKKILLIIFIVFSRLLVSCRYPETYSFLNSTDEIKKITIVQLSFDNEGSLIETEIQKIEDINTFLEDFKKISCYKYFGDPTSATPEGVEDTVIKILYENDDYELINWNGQSKYSSENGFNYYAGYIVFDEQQFESLIGKFLSY